MILHFSYTYQIGHRLFDGSLVWGHQYSFKAPPYPGEDSLQRVVIFGDMGKVSSTSNLQDSARCFLLYVQHSCGAIGSQFSIS
jgi:hypothetical protein